MTFGEVDGGGEVPETPGYAAAESADRARGGGCSPIVGPERLLSGSGPGQSSTLGRARRRCLGKIARKIATNSQILGQFRVDQLRTWLSLEALLTSSSPAT
jgi:hypothetical protein